MHYSVDDVGCWEEEVWMKKHQSCCAWLVLHLRDMTSLLLPTCWDLVFILFFLSLRMKKFACNCYKVMTLNGCCGFFGGCCSFKLIATAFSIEHACYGANELMEMPHNKERSTVGSEKGRREEAGTPKRASHHP